ncbi:MAG: FliH/SctL family protein [Ignavibacterium sp.]
MSNVIKLSNKPNISFRSVKNLIIEDEDFNNKNEVEINREQILLKENYTKGFEEGYTKAKKELELEYNNKLIKKTEEYYEILSNFEEKLNIYEKTFDEVIAKLSLKIADKVIRSEVANRNVVEEIIKEASKKIIGANDVIIKINPKDYELITENGNDKILNKSFNKIKFEPTEAIEIGGCIIESAIGNVDAQISTQLNEIERRLKEVY